MKFLKVIFEKQNRLRNFTVQRKNIMLDPCIVGYVLQTLREQKGLSQEVVSGLADIGRTHLSAIERGVRKPTLETLFRLSYALQMPASEIVRAIEIELEKRAKS